MSTYDGPERRVHSTRPQFAKLDEALLASQITKLDKLDNSVHNLAIAIKQRPSVLDLDNTRKRLRNQLIVTVICFALIAAGLLYDRVLLHQSCRDRNYNATALRELVVVLTEESRSVPPSRVDNALQKYRDSIKIVEC